MKPVILIFFLSVTFCIGQEQNMDYNDKKKRLVDNLFLDYSISRIDLKLKFNIPEFTNQQLILERNILDGTQHSFDLSYLMNEFISYGLKYYFFDGSQYTGVQYYEGFLRENTSFYKMHNIAPFFSIQTLFFNDKLIVNYLTSFGISFFNKTNIIEDMLFKINSKVSELEIGLKILYRINKNLCFGVTRGVINGSFKKFNRINNGISSSESFSDDGIHRTKREYYGFVLRLQ